VGSAKHLFLIYIVQLRTIRFAGTEVIIKIWVNRVDNNQFLIVPTDVDLGDGRKITTSFVFHHSKISKGSICNCTVATF
jgi:hypothetical protein